MIMMTTTHQEDYWHWFLVEQVFNLPAPSIYVYKQEHNSKLSKKNNSSDMAHKNKSKTVMMQEQEEQQECSQ